MRLLEGFEQNGNWLFRWRSYLPLLLVAILLPAMRDYRYPGGSHALDQLWEVVCLGVSFVGLAIRTATVGHASAGTSGRNTREQIATVLNTDGMYSVVRNPLYLGNYFMWLGVSMFLYVWWVAIIFTLVFWIYYERIIFAEEAFLARKFGDAFTAWAQVTPAFVPRFRNWKPAALPFSWRSVLRREYSSFFAVMVIFTALEGVGDYVLKGAFEVDVLWAVLFSLSLTIYLLLRTLKKCTTLLTVEGR